MTKLPNLADFDLDKNLVHIINSKCYEIHDISDLSRAEDSLSSLQSNLRNLSAHVDELKLLLDSVKLPFHIIEISETKEQVNESFVRNVNLRTFDSNRSAQ